MTDPLSPEARVVALRLAFDESFATPFPAATEAPVSLLAVRVADQPCLLRVGDLAELVRQKAIVAVPSRVPAFLGVIGLRGGLVPVYDLAALLGHGRSVEPLPWLVLCGRSQPVGLAFARFEGHVSVAPGEIRALTTDRHECIREAASVGGAMRAVIDIDAVMTAIHAHCSARGRP